MLTAKELAKAEPWRRRIEKPSTLQLDWISSTVVCSGLPSYDPPPAVGSLRWWKCLECGFCSCYSNTTHAKPQHPADYYSACLELFYKTAYASGLTENQAKDRAGYLLGAALRAASKMGDDSFAQLIKELTNHT